MVVQSEIYFSKSSMPYDSLSEGARRMLLVILRVDTISHLHAEQEIKKAEQRLELLDKSNPSFQKAQKALEQKLKLSSKYDCQTWETPNFFLDELISKGFLSLKTKTSSKKQNTLSLLMTQELQAQKEVTYKTLMEAYGIKALHLFEQEVDAAISLLEDLVQTTGIADNLISKETNSTKDSEETFRTNKRLNLLRATDCSGSASMSVLDSFSMSAKSACYFCPPRGGRIRPSVQFSNSFTSTLFTIWSST